MKGLTVNIVLIGIADVRLRGTAQLAIDMLLNGTAKLALCILFRGTASLLIVFRCVGISDRIIRILQHSLTASGGYSRHQNSNAIETACKVLQ